MRPKLNSRVVSGEHLYVVLLACSLLLIGMTLTRQDLYRFVLTGSAVCLLTAVSACLLYFHPEVFKEENSLERLVRQSQQDGPQERDATRWETSVPASDSPMRGSAQNEEAKRESPFDAAVERIVRGIQRDLEVRK